MLFREWAVKHSCLQSSLFIFGDTNTVENREQEGITQAGDQFSS